MQNMPTGVSHYRVFSSTPLIPTAPSEGNSPAKVTPGHREGRKDRKSKLGPVAPKRPTKERKRTMAQKRELEQRETQQREQQEKDRIEQELRQMALLQWQLEEKERARKAREEREFHTHQRRFVLQQRLQEGQNAWQLEWRREQPYLREQLRAEELLTQAQEALQARELDPIYGQFLQDFTELH